jgi:hypothetical protein
MHLSYEDLEKAAADAIAGNAGLGKPGGTCEAIVWTECVLGRGFDLLQLAQRQGKLMESSAPAITDDQGRATIELDSSPLFSVVAHLADLAMRGAAADGFRTVEATGGFGGWVAPHIAFLLSRAQHHAAVLWRPARSEGDAPATLVLAAATAPQQKVSPMLIAPGSAYGGRDRDKLLVGTVPTPLIELLQRAADRHPDQNLLGIVAISAARDAELVNLISIGDAVLSFDLASMMPELLDAEAKLSAAVQSGVNVDSPVVAASS